MSVSTAERCQIFRTIERIKASSYCNVAYIGGSLTAAAGVGNAGVTSWRRLFVRHLYERYHRVYHCQPSEVMGGIGAMESFGAVFTLSRNVLSNLPVLVFVEFCVNDRGSPDKDLVKKGLDGIVQQLKSCRTNPDIVFIGAGNRPGTDPFTGDLVDHSLHREIADYYGLPFIDVQEYLIKALEQRKQTWDDISIVFEEKDNYHLNDYGNYLWFEAVRDWFERQVQLYEMNPAAPPPPMPEQPCFSTEFAHTRLVDPSRRNKAIHLEGSWEKKDRGMLPWYLDNLLVGRPGDKLTYRFTGRALGAICLVYCNGLKIEAKIDGEEVPGPYTNFAIEFGKFFMLQHGMENTEHVLEMEVMEPSPRQNKLAEPTAEIGYLAVAADPDGEGGE